MDKVNTVRKMENLVAGLHQSIARMLAANEGNIPAIEVALLENKLITLYDEVQVLKGKMTSAENVSSTIEAPLPQVEEPEKAAPKEQNNIDVDSIRAEFEALKTRFNQQDSYKTSSIKLAAGIEEADDFNEENIDDELEDLLDIATQELEIDIANTELRKSTAEEKTDLTENKEEDTTDKNTENPAEETRKEEAEKTVEAPKAGTKPEQNIEGTRPAETKETDELEKKTSLNDKFNAAKQPSLHEKLVSQQEKKAQISKQLAGRPIKDLKKAINLNMQIRFQKELFDNDKRAYKRAVDFINKCNTYSEARSYVQHDLARNFKNWDENNPNYLEFMGIVKRRFI
ncbi:hypothetical protein GC194_05465 [bacterium]|nr:hypothetical protein [bacterium]